MCNSIGSNPQCFGESTSIPLICLHSTSARCIHRCLIRICDDNLVTETLEMLGDPFTLGRCFEKNPRRCIISQDRSQPLTTCDYASLADRSVIGDDAELTLDRKS